MRKAIDGTASGLMVLLCFIWGFQQVVVKAAAADIAPILQIGLRSGIAALLVAALVAWRREALLSRGNGPAGLLAGTLFALEYCLVGEGLRYTSASHMVVFLYTAPVFAALGLAWRLPAERLAPVQWLGIALAFGGLAVAFLGPGAGGAAVSREVLLGDLMGLAGGLCWGATTVVIRCSGLAQAPVNQTLFYQLLCACVLLTGAAWATGQAHVEPTPLALGSLAFQALVVSFASFLVWFWLLRTYLASRLGVFSFMTPLFGIAAGVLLLNETLEPRFLAGAALVLAGILLVSGDEALRAHLARRARAVGGERA